MPKAKAFSQLGQRYKLDMSPNLNVFYYSSEIPGFSC